MNSIVQKFNTWITKTESAQELLVFQTVFAVIWLGYDLLDLSVGGTESFLWLMPETSLRHLLKLFQVLLIVSEINLVFGIQPKLFSVVFFLARASQAAFFPINDFFYGAVTSFLLIPVAWLKTSEGHPEPQVPTWIREVLIFQTAWIYFATAFLKLGPSFISGGDLYVRQNYLAKFLHWPYPDFYLKWIATLPANQILAWSAIGLEFALALVLFLGWKKPPARKTLRRLALVLVFSIHSYAALTTNVFFFGFSMIAQVALLTL